MFTGRMLFLTLNQQCQSTEGNTEVSPWHIFKLIHQGAAPTHRVRTDSKKLFSRTLQHLQRPNSRVIQNKLFPGLSRTCKDQIPGFSRTHKTRFQGLSRINSVHKHGCISSKKCTYQISYRCNCVTVTVFLKFKLNQKVTNCAQCFTMNFFSSQQYLYQKLIFPGPLF